MFLLTLLYIIPCLGPSSASRELLEGHEVWEMNTITLQHDNELQSLISTLEQEGKIDILGYDGQRFLFRVFPDSVFEVKQLFEQREGILDVDIKIRDLKSHFQDHDEKEKEMTTNNRKIGPRCTAKNCEDLPTDRYLTYEEIEAYLSNKSVTESPMVKVTAIGNSVEGRSIWMVTIKSDSRSPKGIFIEGGVHAREWISPAVSLHLIKYFINNPRIADGMEINIIPVANPDGYVYSQTRDRLWRKNRSTQGRCMGVDINRNFDYKWGIGASSNPCSQVYKGKSPFSEPETNAIRRGVSRTPDVRLVLSLHSYGQMLLYPWGWTDKRLPNFWAVIRMGRRITNAIYKVNGENYSLRNSAAGLYYASGTTDDWALGVKKVKYSYTLELRDKGSSGFLLPSTAIGDTSAEVWNGVKAAINNIRKE